MRSLMTLSSIIMVSAGIFCVANKSVAFASVAFAIGTAFLLVGVVELVVSRNTSINEDRDDHDVVIGGLMLSLIGIAILSGAVSEDATVTILFAVLISREGFIDIIKNAMSSKEFSENSTEENLMFLLGVAEAVLGTYMFFNKMAINLSALFLIGLAIMLMGIRRFKLSMDIQYSRLGYLTRAQERLADAQREEKRAMSKAKEGIRESKEAQRRIQKIREEMIREHKVTTDTSVRAAVDAVAKEKEKQ